MLLADQRTVCLGCHDKQAKEEKGAKSVHAAFGNGDCTKCHSPHKAGLKKLLFATAPDLCLSCHKAMKSKLAAEKQHGPVDDCLACHRPHVSGQARLTARPVVQLCGDCHDPKDKGFTTAHLTIDAKAIDCVSCHDPHASTDPKLFKAVEHAPFASRQCDVCHVAPKK